MVICLSQKLTAQNVAVSTHASSISLDQIGTVAAKQYSGDGLSVVSSPDGALLHCAFQHLNAHATAKGLWLASTMDGAKGEPFRIVARTVDCGNGETLPSSGRVEMGKQMVRFIRPGLTEEYSVSVDGVRQDFVLEQRPEGTGPVQLMLELDGAKAETIADGACLMLEDGGRKIVYHRLIAKDARGKKLAVRLEVLSANRLAVVLDDSAAEYPVRIDPTFSDANWISIGGLPGVSPVNAIVYAAIVDNAGNLYIGGGFTAVGNAVANYVAKWDGSTWSALGSGISGPNGSFVCALAASGTTLYAGGSFTNAGGISAINIAQWDGNSWSALGPGINGTVQALAISGPNLYAGGNFTIAGGISATNIAQWDGSSWSPLSSGINNAYNYTVYALAVSGTNLYAGGLFTSAGGTPAQCIAQWNGSSWSALGAGINGPVYALAVSDTNLYAGGEFGTAGGVSAKSVAKWNGNSWSAWDSGLNGSFVPVYALAVSGTNLYAGGDFGTRGGWAIAQWNGSSWSALGSGMNSDNGDPYVYALAVSGTNLYAGGNFGTAGGVAVTNIARWNGYWWSSPNPGLNAPVYALAISGTNLYVGGQFTTAGGIFGQQYCPMEREFMVSRGFWAERSCSRTGDFGHEFIRGRSIHHCGRSLCQLRCQMERKFVVGFGLGAELHCYRTGGLGHEFVRGRSIYNGRRGLG